MTDVVLPCLDEAGALPWVLSRMPRGYRVVLADNGSSDASVEIAAAYGARVVSVQQRGFGAAVHAGILASEPEDGVVCVMDADGSFDPAQLPRVADPVRSGTADLALCRRRPTTRGAWPPQARIANSVLAWWLRRGGGPRVHDIGPMRAARRSDLLTLDLRDRRSGYPLEMLVTAGRAGWRITEVDVDYHPRARGTRSKVTGTVGGTTRAIRDMSRVLAR